MIIFDEIQECPNALNSLKYFCDKKNEFHIAAAGSLLGVKLTKGFPVGKVNFLELVPLSFLEFLDAINESELRKLLENINSPKAISEIFHNKLTKLLKYYLVVGGMPEAVAGFVKNEKLDEVRIIQQEILDTYTLDFAKHAPENEVMKIMTIWDLIPTHLAKENKKFIFSAISKSARARGYETSIQWLADAGLIIRSYNITTPKLPLNAYANKQAFKIFMLDVGLLGAISKLDPRVILQGNKLFTEFKGALTENYVAQELHINHFKELYYWTSEGTAEVDFLISIERQIFPLEVKAGVSKQMKSLVIYGNKYLGKDDHTSTLSRASLQNFVINNALVTYPLYAVQLFPRFRSA